MPKSFPPGISVMEIFWFLYSISKHVWSLKGFKRAYFPLWLDENSQKASSKLASGYQNDLWTHIDPHHWILTSNYRKIDQPWWEQKLTDKVRPFDLFFSWWVKAETSAKIAFKSFQVHQWRSRWHFFWGATWSFYCWRHWPAHFRPYNQAVVWIWD